MKNALKFALLMAFVIRLVIVIQMRADGDERPARATPTAAPDDLTFRAIADPNTTCAELQDIFDDAVAVHQEYSDDESKRNRIDTMTRMTSYMNAAEAKMRADGCH